MCICFWCCCCCYYNVCVVCFFCSSFFISLSMPSFVLFYFIHKRCVNGLCFCVTFHANVFKKKINGKSSTFSHLEPILDEKLFAHIHAIYASFTRKRLWSVDICLGFFFSLTYFTPKYFAAIPLIFKRIWCMWFIWFIFIHQKLSCFPLGMLYQKLFISFIMCSFFYFYFFSLSTNANFFFSENCLRTTSKHL